MYEMRHRPQDKSANGTVTLKAHNMRCDPPPVL